MNSHILPGRGTSPKSVHESIQMAKDATKHGIRTIVATPRHLDGNNDNPKLDILEDVIHFRNELEQANIPLTVLAGQEIRLSWDLLERLEKNELLPINEKSTYVLIEFPPNHIPKFSEQILFDLQMKGYIPIIAHPERNNEFFKRPQFLYNLVKKGMLVQLTAGSVTGRFGKKIAKFAHELMGANLVHFISSEANHTRKYPFELKEAYKKIEKSFGKHMHYYFLENTQALIENETIFAEPPTRIKSKKFFGII
ncbi:tyrosine-protein phosphatase [Allobacillus sp. GCM10007489]|uniref:tyrosine-protein phosphatase n=1 Tax=unclassified Allobacillus TaxID=2628859 RepID=UPI002105CDC5|nr:CpsB/CapC family capsule biosynthesis tyrosine phosphatase [Allobacillus sp. SKP2-8]